MGDRIIHSTAKNPRSKASRTKAGCWIPRRA